jgi:hypothetical protein
MGSLVDKNGEDQGSKRSIPFFDTLHGASRQAAGYVWYALIVLYASLASASAFQWLLFRRLILSTLKGLDPEHLPVRYLIDEVLRHHPMGRRPRTSSP